MCDENNSEYSIIEGTKESLERLQLDYVDVIFAHRHDNTGMLFRDVGPPSFREHAPHGGEGHFWSFLTVRLTVPMEEIVRAFNYVIEKGWVR